MHILKFSDPCFPFYILLVHYIKFYNNRLIENQTDTYILKALTKMKLASTVTNKHKHFVMCSDSLLSE